MINSSSIVFAAVLALAASVSAQSTASQYGQCGGIGWTGATLCPSGWSCQVLNSYYYQCLQGASSGTPAPTTAPSPTTTPKPTSTPKSSSGSPTSGTPTGTSSAAEGTTTLQPGYSFIRADEDPNFHKYLQSEVLWTPSTAVLGSPATAAQFQVTAAGQLVQNANGTPLYAIVASRANSTVMMLGMTWSTTPATSGTFVFSGDSLEWSTPSITRPQDNAWLVCPDSAGNLILYINLGAYDYETPAGCADQTLNAYTGATATT